MDCSPPDSTVHGILQARILEWVAVTSSSGSFQCRDQTHISYISCTGRQFLYHWSGFLFLLQRIFPTQGLNPCLLHWQVDSLSLSHQFSSVAQSCPTLRLHAYSTPWLSCPSPTPRACWNSCPSSQWWHPTIFKDIYINLLYTWK